VPCPNAGLKADGVVAGDAGRRRHIDDLDVLRHGGMSRVFTGVLAPSTLGTFLRCFTFGHIRQLDAVHTRMLAGLASSVPRLLAGTETLAFVDIDDTIRQVHRYAKQGAAYGYSGVKGLNAKSRPCPRRPPRRSSPVMGRARLRKGHVISGHGADRLLADAIAVTPEPPAR